MDRYNEFTEKFKNWMEKDEDKKTIDDFQQLVFEWMKESKTKTINLQKLESSMKEAKLINE